MKKAEPRIISLIASATEIVCALGARDQLVGISHECDFPAGVTELPVCSHAKLRTDVSSCEIDRQVKQLLADSISIYGLETETIDSLQPTHLVTQSQCDVCAVSLRDVQAAACERFSSQPQIVVCEPNALTDVWEDIRRVGQAIGRGPEAEMLIAESRTRLQSLAGGAAGKSRPRVACVEWTDPLMAAGNWVPELVEMAGGISVTGEAGKHSPWMTMDQLAAADPDLIVILPCGFDLARSVSESNPLFDDEQFRSLRAVESGQVFAVDGNSYFNRPGPRLVESAELLAHLFFDVDESDQGDGFTWQRLTPAAFAPAG